jgi:tetratricopeptide (TPR) repeat protein
MKLKILYILLFFVIAVGVQAQNQTPLGFFSGQNQFRNNLSFVVKDSLVRFFLRDNLEAKNVIVSGDFINWTMIGVPLTKTDSGWIAYIKLPAGKHWYKFIIDGTWTLDADNFLTEINGEYINNVYYKPNVTFVLSGFSKAKKVYLAASSNDSKPAELQMIKTQIGWELSLYFEEGIYNYYFIVDGKECVDPRNKTLVSDKKGNRSSVVYVGNQSDLMKGFHFYQKALIADNKKDIAVSLADIGNIYYTRSDYLNALNYFQKAKTVYIELKDLALADILVKIADTYRNLSDFPHLLEYLQKATIEYQKSGNESALAKTFRSTGYYYLNLPYLPTAVIYFQRSLSLYKQLNKQIESGNLLVDIGHSYLLLRDTVALTYLRQALNFNQKIDNKVGIARSFWLLGDYHFRVSADFSIAFDYFQKALTLYDQIGDQSGVARILFNLADLYEWAPDSALIRAGILPADKYAISIENQKKGLQIFSALQPESEQLVTLLVLSNTYEKIKKFDSAHHYFKKYIVLRDKIISAEKQKDIVRLETKYVFEKNQDSLKVQQELTDEKLQKQLILARQQQQQLELNQAELTLSNKEKDIQHLAYLKMQSDLQNEQLLKKQNEKEKQLQSSQVKSLTQEKAITKLNQQRQWIYIIGGFLLLVAGSLYFIYRLRLRRIQAETQLVKEKAAQEKKETEFQHKLADISMSALRSQMNPHFIFNCLNSIKLYTTQNDTVAASEYLTKFSRLIRLVLDNSRNERITLSSELAALELYIQMEAMRFKEKLSYSFMVEKNVESSYIEIPPLLLQPYVENAIWHGLMPREEGGHIAINVAMQHDGSLLEINITDNGIGRAAATALSNKMAGKHRSYGMKATTERIALINQIYKTGASIIVHDLVDENGQAAGTEVILQIPV